MRPSDLPISNASWHRFLPRFIRTRLEGRHSLQAILSNSGWLIADRIFRMGGALVVGVWVARYLGPLQLGLLSYAYALSGLYATFATLGIDSIVVRELLIQRERTGELLGTAFVLRLIGGIAAFVASIITVFIIRPGDTQMYLLVGIAAAAFLYQPINVVDYFFQATLQSKYTVYSSNAAFLLASIAKVALLALSAPLIAFAVVGSAEVLLSCIFLLFVFWRMGHTTRLWKNSGALALFLLKESWPLILSGLAITIYMRIDQLMIGHLLGDTEVGLFAAAVRLGEVWYFIPTAVAASVFPAIINSKKLGERIYQARVERFMAMMVWIAIVVALVVTLIGDHVIAILYGQSFSPSGSVLKIHIWAGVFVALGVASSGWYLVENLQKYALYRTVLGGVVNVLLNLFLIPRFGINGAACATVIAQTCAAFLFDASNPKTRPIFWMKVRAIFFPLRNISIGPTA